jgi:hypothetical protein
MGPNLRPYSYKYLANFEFVLVFKRLEMFIKSYVKGAASLAHILELCGFKGLTVGLSISCLSKYSSDSHSALSRFAPIA